MSEIKNWRIKYNIDDLFFQNIDQEDKAYWLGFLYADGSISDAPKYAVELSLNLQDEKHLIKYLKSLKTNREIKYRNSGNSNCCYVHINNKNLATNLIKLGCFQKKSLILKYPTIEQVPTELQHHFIRGYFDGDGSFIFNSSKNKIDSISICGTQELLNGIVEYLQPNYNFTIRLKPNSKIYEFRCNNKEGLLDFYNKFYKDSHLYLDRKYELINNWYYEESYNIPPKDYIQKDIYNLIIDEDNHFFINGRGHTFVLNDYIDKTIFKGDRIIINNQKCIIKKIKVSDILLPSHIHGLILIVSGYRNKK